MATATLQQSSIALDVSNCEVKAPTRRDVSGIFHYLDRSISEQTLNEKTNIACVSSQSTYKSRFLFDFRFPELQTPMGILMKP